MRQDTTQITVAVVGAVGVILAALLGLLGSNGGVTNNCSATDHSIVSCTGGH